MFLDCFHLWFCFQPFDAKVCGGAIWSGQDSMSCFFSQKVWYYTQTESIGNVIQLLLRPKLLTNIKNRPYKWNNRKGKQSKGNITKESNFQELIKPKKMSYKITHLLDFFSFFADWRGSCECFVSLVCRKEPTRFMKSCSMFWVVSAEVYSHIDVLKLHRLPLKPRARTSGRICCQRASICGCLA